MWVTFVQAKGWQVRPSALLGLGPDSWEAYCLDEAVFMWGGWVTQQLEKVKGKNEAQVQRGQEMRLTQILGTQGKGKFRDPAMEIFGKGGEEAGNL
jgi:hypothetical protein